MDDAAAARLIPPRRRDALHEAEIARPPEQQRLTAPGDDAPHGAGQRGGGGGGGGGGGIGAGHGAGCGWIARLPYFILIVSIVEVGVFLWGGAGPQRIFVYHPHRRLQMWRFFSYMLLHADPLHLALNVVIQLVLATPLEYEQGHVRTALIYVGGGIAGSLGTSMMEPELYIVGASAGVYALLISHLSNILLNFSTIRYKIYRTVAVVVLAFTDIVFFLHHHYTFGNVCPRVGLAAHCSGAIAGFLLGLVLFRGQPAKPEDGPWIRACQWTAAALLGAGLTAAIVCNALLPPAPVRAQ